MSTLQIMGGYREKESAGHKTLQWDLAETETVDQARQEFMHKLEEGYLAYTVGEDGKTKEAIREFDPEADRIVLTPAIAGG